MKSTLFVLSAFLVASSLAFADPIGDIASLLQDGDGGRLIMGQSETPGSSEMIQAAQYTRPITQHGAIDERSIIRQDTTFVGEPATIPQYGNADMGVMEAYSSSGSATIEQPDNSNTAIFDQSGSSKIARIDQTGSGNAARVIQH